jgi:hypothetical protein
MLLIRWLRGKEVSEMAATRNFETIREWLEASAAGRPVAIMPNSLAAEALGETPNALAKKLKRDDFPKIVIEDKAYVSADYVHERCREMAQKLEEIRRIVERVAARGNKIVYSELMESVGLNWRSPPDRTRIGALLGDLSHWSWENHGVLLSSIVHRKTSEPTSPGPGYVVLLEQIGDEFDDFEYDPEDDLADLVEQHMQAVWKHYAKA